MLSDGTTAVKFGKTQEPMGKLPSESFLRLHAIIAEQLRSRTRGVIHPRHSRWVSRWDAAVVLGLMYTAVITPVDVCLVQHKHVELFVCNILVDVVFLLDLGLNFCLAYRADSHEGGQWVTDRRRIALRYLRTWFTVDFISVLPFDAFDYADMLPSSASLIRAVRIVRLLRLIKLLRIFRASRIVARWRDFFNLSFAQTSVIGFAALTMFMVHLMACAWGACGLYWYPTEGLTVVEIERPWLEAYGFTTLATHRIYLLSLYVSVVSMFGGVGSIAPQNFAEYMLLTVMMFCGSVAWAWVIGSLCGILATLNPHTTAFRNTMDELNHFMHINHFSTHHRVRLREFFRNTKEHARIQAYDNLFHRMSHALRGDTALIVGRSTLSRVWYFNTALVEKVRGALTGILRSKPCLPAQRLGSSHPPRRAHLVSSPCHSHLYRSLLRSSLSTLSTECTRPENASPPMRSRSWRRGSAPGGF